MKVLNKGNVKLMALFSLCLLTVTGAKDCQAKLLPRYRKAVQTAPNTTSAGIITAVSLRGDRQAINVFFGNLSRATAVSYTLVYQAQGVDKGVSGSIDLSVGDSTNRELVLGTESAGVFKYDTGITNAKLEIVSNLKTGKKTLRRFRIKV